ncbi:MAG: thioredoxin domain-containing protein [Blastocatellia bacterium]|nr:thioredoxin domain-containing protein [Blastocatellia bacterium]
MQASKKYTNKLINESSPYLLQHAHNPVDWYPWGEEAFERARAEDKPLLVSIGYSACHWCHVMEHESFEDEKIAAIQNEHFINIKVDMEERPDVDQIYMNFVQLTTGRGGWPMNVFITPDKLPFFGGTYFPPTQRYNMPSWPQILMSIAEAWDTKRDELLHSANDILGELRRLSVTDFSSAGIDHELSDLAYRSFVKSFDAKNGGFGGAPKFPAAMAMEFLLRYWKRTGDFGALEMVRKTAETMAKGGIYDQLGGGFHRYAVDPIWLVPHFEKMLYDNAQLIRVFLHLYQIAKSEPPASVGRQNVGDSIGSSANRPAANAAGSESEFFKRVAIETLEYVRREMTDTSGAFYSTQDADSEGHEGKFFVWTPEEIAEVLGEEDAKKFCAFYDVTAEGNFEGKNILNSGQRAVDSGQLASWKKAVFESREGRIKPFRDEKVLTAWNGLMLAAFAEAAVVLDNEEYLDVAKENAEFLLREMVVNENEGASGMARGDACRSSRVLRTWKDGKAKLNGYIEDYANLADGLIELHQACGDSKYLHAAKELADAMITEFWDEENGGFFFTSNDHEELIVRNKDFFDNATPSGNSVAADVLLKLAKFYGEEKYKRFASTVLRLAASQIRRFPSGFGRMLSVVEFQLANVKEIAIVGEKGSDLEREIWSEYRPFKLVTVGPEGSDVPLLTDRVTIDGKTTAYVCENFVCQRPVTEVRDLVELL